MSKDLIFMSWSDLTFVLFSLNNRNDSISTYSKDKILIRSYFNNQANITNDVICLRFKILCLKFTTKVNNS